MMDMPSPILLLGDHNICQNNINAATKKYADYNWLTFSAMDDSLDLIRSSIGQGTFMDYKKAVVIRGIPKLRQPKSINKQKDVMNFLLDVSRLTSDKLKIIIYDSENAIKKDEKTNEYNKTWQSFIKELQKNNGCKIVDNGEDFGDKQITNGIQFVKNTFAKYKKNITNEACESLINIVGKNRGMISSEISKLSLISPKNINNDFIMENAYPSSKEAVLYKFSNILDNGSCGDAIMMSESFVSYGINENVLAEIIAKKTRWHLVIAYLWSQGKSWTEITKDVMGMGKFPSGIWGCESTSYSEKKKQSEPFSKIENRIAYMTKVKGLKDFQIDHNKTPKKTESIPMEFMARMLVDFLKNKIVSRYYNSNNESEIKEKLLERCINVHLYSLDKLKEIRYGINPKQDLRDMIIAVTNTKINF